MNASIQGSLTIGSGATVALVGSNVAGSVIAHGAAALTVCGSTLARLLTVAGTTGFTMVGGLATDPGTSCAADTVRGALNVLNSAGLEIAGNSVGILLGVLRNRGPDVVAGNTVAGALVCLGNQPPPTNAGVANRAAATIGQCAS